MHEQRCSICNARFATSSEIQEICSTCSYPTALELSEFLYQRRIFDNLGS